VCIFASPATTSAHRPCPLGKERLSTGQGSQAGRRFLRTHVDLMLWGMNLNALRNRPRPFYAPLAVIVLVLLAACGHQGTSAPLAKGAVSSPTTVPAPAPDPPVATTTTTEMPTIPTTTTTTTPPAARPVATRATTTTTTPAPPQPTVTTTTTIPSPPPAGPSVVEPGAVVSHGGPVRDHVSLVDNLRSRGLSVMPLESIAQPFLRGDGTVLGISGPGIAPTRLQSFEYESAQAAAADAATFGPDGSPRGAQVGWLAPPHLYLKGRVLVIYVGADQAVTALLTDLLGPQFSGR
jgi:hypothetical protein